MSDKHTLNLDTQVSQSRKVKALEAENSRLRAKLADARRANMAQVFAVLDGITRPSLSLAAGEFTYGEWRAVQAALTIITFRLGALITAGDGGGKA